MRNAFERLSARIIGTIPYYSGQREATWQSDGGGMGQSRQCCMAESTAYSDGRNAARQALCAVVLNAGGASPG